MDSFPSGVKVTWRLNTLIRIALPIDFFINGSYMTRRGAEALLLGNRFLVNSRLSLLQSAPAGDHRAV